MPTSRIETGSTGERRTGPDRSCATTVVCSRSRSLPRSVAPRYGRRRRATRGSDGARSSPHRRDILTDRYLVLELKTNAVGGGRRQLTFYVAGADGEVRLERHALAVGLLCASRNERTVRHALARSTRPMAVAAHRYSEPPAAEQAVLPAAAAIVDAVSAAADIFSSWTGRILTSCHPTWLSPACSTITTTPLAAALVGHSRNGPPPCVPSTTPRITSSRQ